MVKLQTLAIPCSIRPIFETSKRAAYHTYCSCSHGPLPAQLSVFRCYLRYIRTPFSVIMPFRTIVVNCLCRLFSFCVPGSNETKLFYKPIFEASLPFWTNIKETKTWTITENIAVPLRTLTTIKETLMQKIHSTSTSLSTKSVQRTTWTISNTPFSF